MKCTDNSLAYYCLLAIMSGSVLAATAFAPHWILQLPAILATAPIFWLLRNVSVRYTYAVGVCFTLAWLIPTTYWYYTFMLPGVAFAASVGWAALVSNLFWLVGLRKKNWNTGGLDIIHSFLADINVASAAIADY